MKRTLHDHFIPHAGNEYAPHILQKAAMTAMLGLVLLSFTIANLQALIWVNMDWLVGTVLPAVVVDKTNDERLDESLGGLRHSATLDVAAQLKAEHMAELGYFAHYAPDGTSPWHWFRATNYAFVHAGENLAVHFNDSGEVMRAWMNSPTHRANIMNGNFTEIGIGVAKGEYEGYDTVFVVQMFGTPAAATAAQTFDAEAITVVTEQVSEPTVAVSGETTQEIPQVAAAEETVVEATIPVAPIAPDTVLPAVTEVPVLTVVEPGTELSAPASVATKTATATLATAAAVDQSQFMSTSTEGVPARAVDTAASEDKGVSFFGFATSPQLVLQFLYMVLGAFVLGALLLSIAIEFRRQQPLQVAYSASLLAVMGGLYYIQTIVTTGATIL